MSTHDELIQELRRTRDGITTKADLDNFMAEFTRYAEVTDDATAKFTVQDLLAHLASHLPVTIFPRIAEICEYCHQWHDEHAREQCLFGSTSFKSYEPTGVFYVYEITFPALEKSYRIIVQGAR